MLLAAGLAVGTLSLRLTGYFLGFRLPETGAWARAFSALPGCLIASLVTVILMTASTAEWGAAAVALGTALLMRSVPLSMLIGVGAVWFFRTLF